MSTSYSTPSAVRAVTATLNLHYRVRVPAIGVLAELHAHNITVYGCVAANLATFAGLFVPAAVAPVERKEG